MRSALIGPSKTQGASIRVVPQGRKECERLPTPVRRLSAQALSCRSPAMGADHVGLGPGPMDEDAVDDPRIAGRASAKTQVMSLQAPPQGIPEPRHAAARVLLHR